MSKGNNQKGFTLVELMVVVIIIGILVAIAVPVYNNVQDNAKKNACKASARTILGAVEVYKADHNGAAPTAIGDLVPNYIKDIPQCPGHGDTPAKDFDAIDGSCPNNIASHAL